MVKEVWSGLIHFVPTSRDRICDGAKGGYVNALAWVSGQTEYRTQVKRMLEDYGVKVTRMKDIGPIKGRGLTGKTKVIRLAKTAQRTHKVQFGTFHLYESEK